MSANTVMVVIPGTTGTQLIDPVSGTVFWPLPASATTEAVQLADLENPNLQPYVVGAAYETMIGYFTNSQNFEGGVAFTGVANAGAIASLSTLPQYLAVPFPYDWRQPNQVTANDLNLTLEIINAAYRGDCEIWLVAHSMGGLISRFLLESGMAKSASWMGNVKGLITLGTPHLGAPLALSAVTQELPLSLFSNTLTDPMVAAFVDDQSYPSSYQLLPPGNLNFVLDSDKNSYSIYSGVVNTLLESSTYNASVANLTEAQQFFSALNYGTSSPPVDYYCIAGTNLLTVTGFTYDASAGTLAEIWSSGDNPLDLAGGGDLVVPKWSALFNNAQYSVSGYPKQTLAGQLNVVANHIALPTNSAVQQQIAKWVGLTLAATADTLQEVPA